MSKIHKDTKKQFAECLQKAEDLLTKTRLEAIGECAAALRQYAPQFVTSAREKGGNVDAAKMLGGILLSIADGWEGIEVVASKEGGS